MRLRLVLAGAVAGLLACFVQIASSSADTPPTVEVRTADGTVLKGQVTGVTSTEITLRTDYGVLRVPAERLSPESRAAIMKPATLPECEARARALETKLAALEQENQDLRKRLASAPAAAASPLAAGASPLPGAVERSSAASEQGLTYSLSSTGKRHDSRCRYFTSGSPCGPRDGVACKICGG